MRGRVMQHEGCVSNKLWSQKFISKIALSHICLMLTHCCLWPDIIWHRVYLPAIERFDCSHWLHVGTMPAQRKQMPSRDLPSDFDF